MNLEELLEECKKFNLKIELPEKPIFTVIARYNRGLGPEYITLKPVECLTLTEAKRLAEEQALEYFASMPEVALKEVMVKPCRK